MKKMILVLLILITVSFSNFFVTEASKSVDLDDSDLKNWTFMLYDDADFTNEWYDPAISDITREIPICKNVNILVLQDTVYGPAKLWKVGPFGFKRVIKHMGEIDMGDYQTLKDFVEFCKENYPAERYWLDLFNHGDGWSGACHDETNNGWLDMREIKKALNETGGVDIISFIAPCLMAAVESVYELKDDVDVFIGSEAINGYDFRVLRPMFNMLNNENHLSNIEIGDKFIDIKKEVESRFSDFIFVTETMSAMKTNSVERLVSSINNLSLYLNDNYEVLREDINNVLNNTQAFYDAIDIYDFAQNLDDISGLGASFHQYIDEILLNLNDTIINEYHSDMYPSSHGLSIFFPRYSYYISEYLVEDVIDFTVDTYWDEFLYNFTKDNNSFIVDIKGTGDFENIQDAIDASSNFTTIYVLNGTYNENIVVNKAVILLGEDNLVTFIKGNNSKNIVEIKSDDVVFYNFNINNSKKYGVGISLSCNYSVVFNCIIENNNIGVSMLDSVNNLIFYNKIINNSIGINIYDSDKNSIENNHFINNKKDAFFSDSYKNKWKKNFWNRPHLLPKIIRGERTFHSIKIPVFNIDFWPSKTNF